VDRRAVALLNSANNSHCISTILCDFLLRTARQQWYPRLTEFSRLHAAAYFGADTILRRLLDNCGVKAGDASWHLDARETWNRTPMSWAAKKGHEAIVRLLLDLGVDVEAKNIFRIACEAPGKVFSLKGLSSKRSSEGSRTGSKSASRGYFNNATLPSHTCSGGESGRHSSDGRFSRATIHLRAAATISRHFHSSSRLN
jgi:hypothetical protein